MSTGKGRLRRTILWWRDLEFVCEDCLIQERLSELNTVTNDCDVEALKLQIAQLCSGYTEQEVEKFSQEKSFEIIYRTPRIQTWQDYLWPAHCGDYCKFIKEVGQSELLQIAKLEEIKDLLAIEDETDFRFIWESIRKDIPVDNSTAYDIGIYLFQCLHCNEYVVLWDEN